MQELGTEVLEAAHKYDVKDMEEVLRPLVGTDPDTGFNRAIGGCSEAVEGSTSATASLVEAADAPDGASIDSNVLERPPNVDDLNTAINDLLLQ